MADQDLKWKTGESALVLFPAPNNLLWRELVVVKQFATGECVVVTPDSKLCRVSLKSPPLIDIRRLGPDRALPGDIKEVDCYMVNEATADGFFTTQQMVGYLEQAEQLEGARATQLAQSRAARALVPGTPPVSGGFWVMAEPHSRFAVGDVVDLPAPSQGVGGGRGLFDVDGGGVPYLCQYLEGRDQRDTYVLNRMAELRGSHPCLGVAVPDLGADARTLEVSYRPATGERHKPFSEAVNLMTGDEFDDWPVEGPRTTRWLVESIEKSGAPPLDRHHRWVRDAELLPGDRSRWEHETLSRAFDLACTYDQLCLPNLASFEVLARRMQLLEQAHLDNPSAPDYTASAHFMGSVERRGGALISPGLHAHVARRLGDESAVLKEKRKAAEARQSNRTLHSNPQKTHGAAGDKK